MSNMDLIIYVNITDFRIRGAALKNILPCNWDSCFTQKGKFSQFLRQNGQWPYLWILVGKNEELAFSQMGIACNLTCTCTN